MPVHPKCGKAFPAGERAGHCGACCETFIGNTAFEAHRVGAHGTPERRCEIQSYESTSETGSTVYGHWQNESGHYRHGRQLTKEETKALFANRNGDTP